MIWEIKSIIYVHFTYKLDFFVAKLQNLKQN